MVTLGPSGSGKTVFLAALQERLRTQSLDLGFYAKLPRPQERKLSQVYAQVASAGEWPPPTQRSEMPEWTFTCCVRSPYGVFQTMKVRYIDYAGEHLTHPVDGESSVGEWFEERLETADALLGLLDGMKVRDLMFGKADAETYFRDELRSILSIMQDFDGPIHFVLTKWDLVEKHFTLTSVKQRLLRETPFHDLVESRKPARTRGFKVPPGRIRLIPVSAVGPDFATLDHKGNVHKVAQANPRPVQVELPLVAVLPDLCVRAYEALATRADDVAAWEEAQPGGAGESGGDAAADEPYGAPAPARRSPSKIRRVLTNGLPLPLTGLFSAVGVTVSQTAFAGFLNAAMDVMPQMGARPETKERRRAKRLQSGWWHKRLKRVRTDKEAVRYTIHRLVDRLLDFEETEKESTLA